MFFLKTGSYVFNTEGHPIDTAALHCCSAEKKAEDIALQEFHDNLDLLSLFNIRDEKNNIPGVQWVLGENRNQQKEMQEFLSTLHKKTEVPVSHNEQRLKSGTKGDHQQLLSTDGQVFVSIPADKTKSNVKVSISGNGMNIKRDRSGSEDLDHNDKFSQTDKSDFYTERNDIQNRDIDSDKKGALHERGTVLDKKPAPGTKEGNKVSKDFTPNQQTVVLDTSQTSYKNKESLSKVREMFSNSEKEGTPKNVNTGHGSFTQPGDKTETSKSGAKLNELMKMLQSFTMDILGSSVDSTHRALHEKLKYYDIGHRSKPELLTCKAQPYYSRFSVLGEMFLENVNS